MILNKNNSHIGPLEIDKIELNDKINSYESY